MAEFPNVVDSHSPFDHSYVTLLYTREKKKEKTPDGWEVSKEFTNAADSDLESI